MKKIILFPLLAFILPFAALAHPKVVVLLRHAEEPKKGNTLSEAGFARAKKLPLLFKTNPALKNLGTPEFLFAAGAKNADSSIRSIQTLDSLSETLQIPIDSSFKRDDFRALAEDIDTNPKYEGKVVVIVWQHTILQTIADDLRVKNPPPFPDKYDRIWLITYEPREGKKDKALLQEFPQHLMPGDSVK